MTQNKASMYCTRTMYNFTAYSHCDFAHSCRKTYDTCKCQGSWWGYNSENSWIVCSHFPRGLRVLDQAVKSVCWDLSNSSWQTNYHTAQFMGFFAKKIVSFLPHYCLLFHSVVSFFNRSILFLLYSFVSLYKLRLYLFSFFLSFFFLSFFFLSWYTYLSVYL
jgi:hypothetical protein